MNDELNVLEIVDAHLALPLLMPGEEDVPPAEAGEGHKPLPVDGGVNSQGGGATSQAAEAAPQGGGATSQDAALQAPLPENLAEDYEDEMLAMIDELADLYGLLNGWEPPLVYGFVDGVLAVADDSWSALEDLYYADARNPRFAEVDRAIDSIAQAFNGERPWDEAAKGYVRREVARLEGQTSQFNPDFWRLCAHGFFYGADAAYDLEWKVMVTPAGNVLLTDEESINEAALARLEAEGSGSLMDRVFNMMGIDPDELAAAFSDEDDDAEGAEGAATDEA